jgi:general stress protein 26
LSAAMDIETAKRKCHAFIHARSLAVIATTGSDGKPEAALMNIAVTPELEIIFETTDVTRKFANLKANSRVSFVIGWDDDETLQYDGVAEWL